MRYPGGKAGSGVYQRIISQMPPHDVYVEPFLGGGAVMRMKRPARYTIGIDLDGDAVQRVAAAIAGSDGCCPGYDFVVGDGISYLRECRSGPGWLVYCDPPYLVETRSCQRRMYRYELERARHVELLDVCRRLPALVMVSGYSSEMYDQALSTWRVVRYRTMTRGGRMADECLWCNFTEPEELHDYRYLGRDFRERERIRRKQARWVARLSRMTKLERRAVESALLAVRSRERNA